jgi:peptidoglycan/xylan/chitin deacetylase (PgdA/CDA1 family)
MYHAVGTRIDIDGADPHYAVSAAQFESQIQIIAESEVLAEQIKTGAINKHCITFDDGHLSNFTVAFPLLKKYKLVAEFYINTDNVGTDNFMNWEQLAEMIAAGMSIQSHGHHHYYFSDLSEDEVRNELETSKRLIEEKLGNEVTVFAPPGGRINNSVVDIASQVGYRCIATSIPGTVSKQSLMQLPRFAVLFNTTDAQVAAWKRRFSLATLKQRIRYIGFGLFKKILGNGIYDKIRALVLNEPNENKL